ncbi:MAG: orotidine 5'-phosphate decarboxylase [Actinomycetota bacterium]|nr:orotidine 5'-phosphate decarboxylase [Actinomycetota bacterium]
MGEAGLQGTGEAAERLRKRLALALDVGSAAEAVSLARTLHTYFGVAKIGLQLFVAEGPAVVAQVAELGMDVFLDLKLHDIPNTVRGAARSAAATGARWVTAHAAGGDAMLAAAVEGFARGGPARGVPARGGPGETGRGETGSGETGSGEAAFAHAGRGRTTPPGSALGEEEELHGDGYLRPGVLAVTVLTSSQAGEGEVERLATAGQRCGCSGVVCAAAELPDLRRRLHGVGFVVPGLRMEGDAPGDQARVATPERALAAGAALAVVGRSVTASADPEAAARRLWSSLAKIL